MKNLQDAAAPSRCRIRSRNRGDMVQQTPETKATSGVHTDGIQYACSHWLLCPMVKSLRRRKLAMVVSISVGVHGYGISRALDTIPTHHNNVVLDTLDRYDDEP